MSADTSYAELQLGETEHKRRSVWLLVRFLALILTVGFVSFFIYDFTTGSFLFQSHSKLHVTLKNLLQTV